MKKLTDTDVLNICTSEIENTTGDLADQRREAMDRYLGEDYGDEVEGRSKVKTREVLETVEGLMPSLMRIFADEENLISFQAQGPEDEEQAEQESDVVSHIFWKENKGFFNLYSFCKDAMLSKAGVLKCWADKYENEEREEYSGLDDVQLGQLLQDKDAEREVEEYEVREDGHHVVFATKWKGTKICIEPVAPEETGVSRDARSPYICDARISWCKHKKSLAELLLEGYDEELLRSLPSDDEVFSVEQNARRNLSDETFGGYDKSDALRSIWVTEAYVKLDRDGDGIPELLKVTFASGQSSNSGGKLMDIEEVDAVPLFSAPAIVTTHKYNGLSIADLVLDIQQINTVLLRQVLDNTYLANQSRTGANSDYVNIDDLLTRRPGGVVRFKGDMPIQAVLAELPAAQLPPQTFEVFERLDERLKRRTGMGDEVAGLDVNALSNLNTGVAAMAFEMARSKIELLARVIAEIGLKPLFHHIHSLMHKNGYKARAMKLRGRWVEVNPSAWKQRTDSDVMVGIGKISRERRIMGFEAIAAKQDALVAAGAMGTLVMPWHIYESNRQWARAMGFEPSMFFQDPRQLPPPPPQAPSAQDDMMKAQSQALMMDGQSKMMRAQNEQAKIALDGRRAEMEERRIEMEALQSQASNFMKAEIERLKASIIQHKSEVDVSGKVVDMQHQQKVAQAERQMELLKLQLDQMNATRDRDLEYFKVLASKEEPQDAAKEAQQAQKEMDSQGRDALLVQLLSEVRQTVSELREKDSMPRDIEYDDNGLMRAIGGKQVMRDASGKAVRIG